MTKTLTRARCQFAAAVFCLFLAACANPAGHQTLEIGQTRATPTFEITRASERVFAIKRSYVGSNAGFVILQDGVLVVDTHVSATAARETLEAIEEVTDLPVRYVVNTHWHTDHMLGNRSLYEALGKGIAVISHSTARKDMIEHGPLQAERAKEFIHDDLNRAREVAEQSPHDHSLDSFINEQSQELPNLSNGLHFLPNITFTKELKIHDEIGDVHFLFAGPAHTDGDVLVYIPALKVLFAGDFVTVPQLYLGGTAMPIHWARGLRALSELEFDTIVIGHGGPVIDREPYLTLLISLSEHFETHCQAAFGRGQNVEEATESLDFSGLRADWLAKEPGRSEMFDKAVKSFGKFAVSRAYAELEQTASQ